MMLFFSIVSIFRSLAFSEVLSFCIGICVISDTISLISVGDILIDSTWVDFVSCVYSNKSDLRTFFSVFNESTTSKSPLFMAFANSCSMARSRFLVFCISMGSRSMKVVFAPARSMISKAESGNVLPVTYLSASSTAVCIASRV